MDREFAEKWLKKLKEYWENKDMEGAVSLFTKTTFYQETPFMIPYTTIDKQFEYNTYIRDFFNDNKGKSLEQAIK